MSTSSHIAAVCFGLTAATIARAGVPVVEPPIDVVAAVLAVCDASTKVDATKVDAPLKALCDQLRQKKREPRELGRTPVGLDKCVAITDDGQETPVKSDDGRLLIAPAGSVFSAGCIRKASL